MEVQAMGNTGWLMRHEDHLIDVDLDLNHPLRSRGSLVSADEIAPDLEYVFITHEHGDHFNLPMCSEFVRFGACRFLLPESCLPGAPWHSTSVRTTSPRITRTGLSAILER